MVNINKMLSRTTIVVILTIALCTGEPPIQRGRIVRFPGPIHHTQKLSFTAHLEAAPASGPYPPAGEKPEVPFDLPTEAEHFEPEPTYGPPDQTYGPPDQTYGPPNQTYGPPDQTYGPPDDIYSPPEIEATYSRQFFPQTELTLPHAERLTVFRPLFSVQSTASVVKLAKLVRLSIPQQLIPQSVLTLPKFERLIAFRPQPVRKPSTAVRPAKLRRPIRHRGRPAKLQVNANHRQEQPFAQLQPHIRRPIFRAK